MTFIFNALQDMVMGHRQDQKPGGLKVRTATDGRTQPISLPSSLTRSVGLMIWYDKIRYDTNQCQAELFYFRFFVMFFMFPRCFPLSRRVRNHSLEVKPAGGEGGCGGGAGRGGVRLQHLNHSLHVQYHAQKYQSFISFTLKKISVTHSQLSSASIWL